MKTNKLYLQDSSTLSGECTITELISGDAPVIRISDTYFYPQGGGQKSDIGTIGESQVLKVVHNGDFVDHIVDTIDGFVIGETYPFQINEAHRSIQTRYHTAGHLIANVMERAFPSLKALAGHQWPGEARVEFEGTMTSDITNERVQELMSDVVKSNVSTHIEGDPFVNRSLAIGDFSAIPCGGTHVKSVSEIGMIVIDSTKEKKGRIRVSYHLD